LQVRRIFQLLVGYFKSSKEPLQLPLKRIYGANCEYAAFQTVIRSASSSDWCPNRGVLAFVLVAFSSHFCAFLVVAVIVDLAGFGRSSV